MPALPLTASPDRDTDDNRLAVTQRASVPGREFAGPALGEVTRKPISKTHAADAPAAAELIRSDQDLVVRLCRMPVDLAAPLLRASLPTLTPQALLALIAATGEAHHCLVAARPGLDWRVVKALFRTQNDKVLIALARNQALSFDDDDEIIFARRAMQDSGVRDAVLGHAGLRIAKAHLRLHRGEDRSHGNLKLLAMIRGGETAAFVREMAQRLKLDIAGLSRLLASASPVPLALTLCAAGLDRAVFPHILSLWQVANDGQTPVPAGQAPLLLSVFSLTATEARRKLAVLIDTTR